MKFLLAVSVNHQELKEKITEHLADIGEQFKIVDSYVRSFPESEMVDHVIGAYTSFLSFLQLSIDWCRENGFGQSPGERPDLITPVHGTRELYKLQRIPSSLFNLLLQSNSSKMSLSRTLHASNQPSTIWANTSLESKHGLLYIILTV